METKNRYSMFPVGARVRLTRETYDGVQRGDVGTVTNHGVSYVHVKFDSTPDLIHPCKTDEIAVIIPKPERTMDVNRVYFRYNDQARSGILNKIEVHPGTGNILMWVREDGTGDLKAFDLRKLGYSNHGGREVLVEGVSK